MGKKKSVFVKNLKTFKSSFTGEEREYRINNGLWVFMRSDFDLAQIKWSEEYDDNQAYYGSIFATCLLKANGHEVTFDEVIQNTDVEDIATLIAEYIQSLYKDIESKQENDGEDKESPS
jgi:hypothetical protein